MSINQKQFAGRIGEVAAAEYLRKKGYKIIDRNFRIRNGEIDIVSIVNNILVFVEVKTRLSHQFGTPFEAISYYKMQALVRTAEFYKMTHKKLPDAMRIDAISVMLDDEHHVSEIEHIESIT